MYGSANFKYFVPKMDVSSVFWVLYLDQKESLRFFVFCLFMKWELLIFSFLCSIKLLISQERWLNLHHPQSFGVFQPSADMFSLYQDKCRFREENNHTVQDCIR